ncbi:hypothetical protein [Streptomyces sp. MMBL 11-1]|uniref:hypothetical protein n=1 Tax=Streptomyces sp. MMBL 11-1 TaxID=3026420 RepID=UPI002362E048|nr:hypothetical protein [Streptomyces sp. MMBL 11-1]
MTQQPATARDSRLANQPALRPVARPPATATPPTFEELAAQADARDYGPLTAYLDGDARIALDLPAAPQVVPVDRELAERIRDYLFDRPELVGRLPDAHRDLINL